MLAAEHVTSRFPAKIQSHDYYTIFFNSGTDVFTFLQLNVHRFKVVFAILLNLISNRSNNNMAVSKISTYF